MSAPSQTGTRLAFAILGPLRVTWAGAEIALGGRQQRAVLARLLTAGAAGASLEQLADMLWGRQPPNGSVTTIQTYVSHLRRLLEPDRRRGAQAQILTTEHGRYRLAIPPDALDAVLFERAVAASEGLPAGAAATELRRGLALWRGEVLADLADFEFVAPIAARLDERRLAALEAFIDRELELGRAASAVSRSEELIRQHPLREQLQQRLMLGLYRAGRQSEALTCYDELRRHLRDELGIDPSAPLQRLHQQILVHDPALDWQPQQGAEEQPSRGKPRAVSLSPRTEPTVSPPPGIVRPGPASGRPYRPTRRRIAVTVLAAAITAVVVTMVVGRNAHKNAVSVSGNSIVALDSSGSITAKVAVGARPVAIASSPGALWVANLDDDSVSHIDMSSGEAVRGVSLRGAPSALAAINGAVWVTDDSGHISKIDPTYNRVARSRQLSALPVSYNRATAPLLAAFGSIWIVDPDGFVSRADPDSARQQAPPPVDVGNAPSAIAAGPDSVWVTNSADGTVTRIDPETMLTATFPVGHGPAAVAVNANGVWVANAGDNKVVRVDPETGVVTRIKTVGDGPTALLATPTALWVANSRDGTVMRLDPRSGSVIQTISLGGTPDALAAAGGRVWVAVAPAPPPPAAAGGVAHLTIAQDFESLDPSLPSRSELEIGYATCANLVTYPDARAPDGSRIVPEVAVAVPTPTDGGRKYSFTIRSGFRFSPPSNQAVTAATFKSTIERVTAPTLKSLLAVDFSAVVGYHAYVDGKAPDIAGIVARANVLTITLSRPDGALLANLAGGAACAVPRDTPVVKGGLNDIPSAGPYYIASYTPRQQLVLKQNPNYHGDRPHHLDQIVVAIGIDPSRALSDIEAGRVDYALGGLSTPGAAHLAARYGRDSAAARAGHQQYFVNPAIGARYLFMNTSRPLFSDVRLRRAVNYAIDRAALAAQGLRFPGDNPFTAGQPTDAYTPPSMAGATDAHLYPLRGPDLSRAKQLAGPIHASAIMYTPNTAPWQQEAKIVHRNLNPLGIDVVVKKFPFKEFYNRIAHRGEPFDLAVSGWESSTIDPGDVFSSFDGRIPPVDGNFSNSNDPAFDRELSAAAKLSGVARYRAYGQLELELQRDLVPAAPFATNVSLDFFSARMGCEVYQPITGMDIAALCLRR